LFFLSAVFFLVLFSFPKEVKMDSCTAIFNLNGDYRGFAPPVLNSIVSSEEGDSLQVACAKANGTESSGFQGVYYVFSLNGGLSWSAPELITSTGPFTRNYNSIEVSYDGYPYIAVNYKTLSYSGVWLTVNQLGTGQTGGWSPPELISDTLFHYAFMPSIAVSSNGERVAFMSNNKNLDEIGINHSSDYGFYWSGYSVPASLNNSFWDADVNAVRWGSGLNVHAFLGMAWYDETRFAGDDISAARFNGYSFSSDGGATWSVPIGLFESERRPMINSLVGDTIVYYKDVVRGNGKADSLPVKAYFNPSTGYWADSLGFIDAENFTFGSWWTDWDADYFDEVSTFFYVMPMNDLFVDYYYVSGGDLYTFPGQGKSVVFGSKQEGGELFSYDYIYLHETQILDTLGSYDYWRGSPAFANICFDSSTGNVYIIYMDNYDVSELEDKSSIEALKINDYKVYRASLAEYTDLAYFEAASFIEPDGDAHLILCDTSYDSLYYRKVNVKNPSLIWEYVGVSHYSSSGDYTPPTAFNLISPNGDYSDSTVIFRWHKARDASPVIYHVYVDGSPLASTLDTFWSERNLIPDGSHTWTILAYDDSGNSRASADTFVLNLDTKGPTPPLLVFPDDNSTDSSSLFIWKKTIDNYSGVKYYTFSYALDSLFNSPVRISTYDTLVEPSLSGGSLYWRVSATDSFGNVGSWSEIRKYTYSVAGLAETSIPERQAEKSPRITLSPGYIIFSTVTNDNEFSVFDITGKEICRKTEKHSGKSIITTESFSSGVYFVRLRDGNLILQEKCVIIK